MGLLFTRISEKHLKIQFGRENNPDRPFNQIRTTKYSLITFIPKALILQFTRAANFVYLISAVLQSISIISSLSPITAIGPLIFVLVVGLMREGYEDYKRHSKDVQINERIADKLQNGVFKQIKWQSIKAGDIIKVKNNEIIPCDMVLLYTTEQNSICYVQTSNLDGQTNLKTKFAFVQQIFLYPDQFDLLQGYLQVQRPNSDLYCFQGKIKLMNHEQKNLDFQNILLRQTHLRNTTEVVGIAVYCGLQSKIMMNKGHIQHKITHVQKKVNIIQFVLFMVLILLCIVCSICYYFTHNHIGRDNFFYLKNMGLSLSVQAVLIFFTCFLLLNFLIPISLNVLLQFIKAFLTGFLGFDKKFNDQFCPDGIHTGNMSIMQQLGVVDYILTDKTGTLTANQMIFRSCCIQDKIYDKQELKQKIQNLNQNSAFHNFWLAVVICHDVVKDNQHQRYQGSSPDQVCFIEYAKTIGYQFIKRTKNYIELNIRNQKVVYQLLEIISFSSRRRMSVVVKQMWDKNQILLFTKGADQSIFSKSNSYKYQQNFEKNINTYATQGLRTLVFSYKKMTSEELNQFQSKKKDIAFHKFSKTKSIEQIQQEQISMIQETENNLNILGATAIQDKLQDKVPQTIARLQEAGIKIMMITGDKLQTAQNIGHLANLIKKNFKIVHIRANTENVNQIVHKLVQELQGQTESKIGVVIEGTSIKKIVEQENPEHILMYVNLLKKSTSVIFCRSSPKQKALIVKFVKNHLKGIVLAIGDGGNDIGMIEQANIGIGILGRQGKSAAAASDFYFGQFKHLDRLLLHHGRWFYMRISYFFVYYGWKNLIMTVIMFLFIIRSAFSGYPAFSQFYITMYNLIIGMFLIGSYSVWQQDINDDLYPDIWQKLPLLYKDQKSRDLFSYKRYLIWTVMGIGIGVVLDYFINISAAQPSSTDNIDGFPATYDSLYLIKSFSLNIITLLVIIMELTNITWYIITVVLGVFTFGFLFIIYILQNTTQYGRGYRSLVDNDTTKFYLIMIVVTGVTIGVKTIINMGKVQFFPSEVDKILKQKKEKGYLSIQNLNPHFHPKQLILKMTSNWKNDSNDSNDSNSKCKKKKSSKNKEKKEKTFTKEKIGTQIQLNARNNRIFQE